MKRVEWIDAARGLGILSVVYGHALGNAFDGALYTFHIPLFFLLSGFVYHPSGTLKGYAVHRARQLLVPYAFWLTLISIPGFALAVREHHLPRSIVTWAFGGILLGGQTGPMWFATVLYLALVLYDALRKHAPGSVLPIVVGAYVVVVLRGLFLPTWSFVWDADVALFALPFLHLGAVARERGWTERKPLLVGLAAAFVGYVVLSAMGIHESNVDLKQSDFGWPVANVAIALGGTALWVLLAQHAGPLTKPLAYAGKASLLVMFLHFAVLVLCGRLGLYDGRLAFVAAVGVPLALYPIFQRFRPTRIVLLGEVGSGRPKSPEEPRLAESHTTAPAA